MSRISRGRFSRRGQRAWIIPRNGVSAIDAALFCEYADRLRNEMIRWRLQHRPIDWPSSLARDPGR
jgi:hypothetical protein